MARLSESGRFLIPEPSDPYDYDKTTYAVTCQECGSTVQPVGWPIHDDWHERTKIGVLHE